MSFISTASPTSHFYDATFTFATNAAVGARGDTFLNSFHGAVDELTIYDRALSPADIQAIAAAGAAAKCKDTRVSLEHAAYPNGEASGPFALTVRRSGDATAASTVAYATSDGTATAGQDYTASSGTLTFAAGELVKTIQVPVTNDTTPEADETLQIALSSAVRRHAGTALHGDAEHLQYRGRARDASSLATAAPSAARSSRTTSTGPMAFS